MKQFITKPLYQFILLGLFLIANMTNGQLHIHTADTSGNPSVIKLDFITKKYISKVPLDKFKRGDFYQVEIDNINLNAYKVTINNRDSITQTGLTIPTFAS